MVGIGSPGDEGHYVYDPSVSLGHQQFIHDLVSPVGAVNHDDEFVVGVTYCIDAIASCELRFERLDVNLPISLSAPNADAALLVLQSNGDLRSTEVLRGPQNDSILALEAISGGLILSGTTTGLSFDVNGQTVLVQTDIDPIYPDFLPRAAFVARLSDAGTYAWVNKVVSDERDEMPALLISSDAKISVRRRRHLLWLDPRLSQFDGSPYHRRCRVVPHHVVRTQPHDRPTDMVGVPIPERWFNPFHRRNRIGFTPRWRRRLQLECL